MNHFLFLYIPSKGKIDYFCERPSSEGPSDGRSVIAPAVFSSSQPCRSSPSRSSSWRALSARSSVLPSTPFLRFAPHRQNLGRRHRINTGARTQTDSHVHEPSIIRLYIASIHSVRLRAAASCDEATPPSRPSWWPARTPSTREVGQDVVKTDSWLLTQDSRESGRIFPRSR